MLAFRGNYIPDPVAEATTAVSNTLSKTCAPETWLWQRTAALKIYALCRAQEQVLPMQADSVDFVPMIYGDCCGINDLPGSLPDTAKTLLGFNEPNHWCASALLLLGPGPIWDAIPLTSGWVSDALHRMQARVRAIPRPGCPAVAQAAGGRPEARPAPGLPGCSPLRRQLHHEQPL